MNKENKQETDNISKDLLNFINLENKREFNQKRTYYRHNISLNYLEDEFYYKPKLKSEEVFINSSLDFEQKIDNANLFESLKKLKPCDIEIIRLRYDQQLSFKEIAEKLNMKENTVGKRHERSLQKLRNYMIKKENKNKK